MRRILVAITICTALLAPATTSFGCDPWLMTIQQAVAGDANVRASAIEKLRNDGPMAMAAIADQRDSLVKRMPTVPPENAPGIAERITKLNAIMDAVGGARYCSSSKLFWYTDLEQAKQVSAAANKPILSLRMLGKLTEEFSCANSRFFRTTLYANTEISDILRDKFVLHWESVRPVPRVTIDFGDGRKLERTLTGNSIHYVLNKDGRPLDGLPGLHGPAAFKTWLAQAEQLATDFGVKAEAEREAFLQQYHRERADAVGKAFAADLARVDQRVAQPQLKSPNAEAAANIAMPKRRAEIGIIRHVALDRSLPETMEQLDDSTWQQIAALHADASKLDEASVALIRAENPNARLAGRLAISKAFVEDPLARLVQSFQTSIALDTVRNEYVLHRRLHQWFAEGSAEREILPLNERVYAQLFLTPSSDPWLGLMTPNTYTALTNGGVGLQQVKN